MHPSNFIKFKSKFYKFCFDSHDIDWLFVSNLFFLMFSLVDAEFHPNSNLICSATSWAIWQYLQSHFILIKHLIYMCNNHIHLIYQKEGFKSIFLINQKMPLELVGFEPGAAVWQATLLTPQPPRLAFELLLLEF